MLCKTRCGYCSDMGQTSKISLLTKSLELDRKIWTMEGHELWMMVLSMLLCYCAIFPGKRFPVDFLSITTTPAHWGERLRHISILIR